MKICSKCGIEKEETEFDLTTVNNHRYLRTICKECRYLQAKIRYKNRSEDKKLKTAENKRNYYSSNIEKNRENTRQYRQQNKDRLSKLKKEWYQDNKSKVSANCKKYREINKEKILSSKRNWQKTKYDIDGVHKLKCLLRSNIGNALRKNGFCKTNRTQHIIGCSYEELIIHLGVKPSENPHLDHICPVSQAQNEEEIIKLQHYSNLRWLTAEENLSKSNSWTPEAEDLCNKLLGREWIY